VAHAAVRSTRPLLDASVASEASRMVATVSDD